MKSGSIIIWTVPFYIQKNCSISISLKDKIKMFTHIKDIQLLSSEKCSWLHNHLNSLPLVKFPFDVKSLPSNGVYFFYEEGEITEHRYGFSQRIVRIGTHKENNFSS